MMSQYFCHETFMVGSQLNFQYCYTIWDKNFKHMELNFTVACRTVKLKSTKFTVMLQKYFNYHKINNLLTFSFNNLDKP